MHGVIRFYFINDDATRKTRSFPSPLNLAEPTTRRIREPPAYTGACRTKSGFLAWPVTRKLRKSDAFFQFDAQRFRKRSRRRSRRISITIHSYDDDNNNVITTVIILRDYDCISPGNPVAERFQ